jgi:P pilus assembly chaperone PapD
MIVSFLPRLAAPMLALALALPAQAELMLNPTRVVLSRNQRAAQVELINDGGAPASYRISVVNRRMDEHGQLSAIDEPGPDDHFAGPMLSYSPRQVTLQPGTAQVVRVMVRKPEGLADGEYRSHLHFEKLPDARDMASSVEDAQGAGQIGVVLKTLIGVSIPVIVRHGECAATASLSALALQPGKAPQLAFRLGRGGCASVYGDLAASFTPAGGVEQPLGRANGVAVYPPNGARHGALQLTLAPGTALAHGQLRLTYRERADAGARLLAEAVLTLP